MDTLADPQGTSPADARPAAAEGTIENADVPGQLAGQIGDMYAAEERERRAERTELMIARALEHQ